MKCRSFDSAEAFEARTAAFFQGREAENTLLLGLLPKVGKTLPEGAAIRTVEGDGEVKLAALVTPSRNLFLSHGDPTGLPYLLSALRAGSIELTGMVGPALLAERFAEEWRNATSREVAPKHAMALYGLTAVSPPRSVPGALSAVTGEGNPWLADWFEAFARDAHLSPDEIEDSRKSAVRRADRGEVFAWLVDDRPVSIAAFQDTMADGTGGRINAVYTPLEERGKGYASACVAHLCQRLLDRGWDFCTIFADLTNPVTNTIYQRIGFEEIGRLQSFSFLDRK